MPRMAQVVQNYGGDNPSGISPLGKLFVKRTSDVTAQGKEAYYQSPDNFKLLQNSGGN